MVGVLPSPQSSLVHIDYISHLLSHSSTYDHRILNSALPVRSAVLKQDTSALVLGWVTTGEYALLYVFAKNLSFCRIALDPIRLFFCKLKDMVILWPHLPLNRVAMMSSARPLWSAWAAVECFNASGHRQAARSSTSSRKVSFGVLNRTAPVCYYGVVYVIAETASKGRDVLSRA